MDSRDRLFPKLPIRTRNQAACLSFWDDYAVLVQDKWVHNHVFVVMQDGAREKKIKVTNEVASAHVETAFDSIGDCFMLV